MKEVLLDRIETGRFGSVINEGTQARVAPVTD